MLIDEKAAPSITFSIESGCGGITAAAFCAAAMSRWHFSLLRSLLLLMLFLPLAITVQHFGLCYLNISDENMMQSRCYIYWKAISRGFGAEADGCARRS